MSNFRSIFLSMVAVSVLCVMSSAAVAQDNPNQTDTNNARNNPCREPWVSLAVSVVKTVGSTPGRADGSGDSGECNIALYNNGHWNSYRELLGYARAQVPVSAYEKKLGSGISLVGAFKGRDGNTYHVFKKGDAIVGVNVGVVGTAGGSLVSGHLCSTNGGNVIAQGGGNLVPGATVIAQGGGNLIGHDGASVIAQGGGNLTGQGSGSGRVVLAAGSTLFQFPNRYAVVSGPPQSQPARPATPPASGGSSGSGDAQTRVLLCINSSSGVLRTVRGKAGNSVSFTLGSSQVAVFQGNVQLQSDYNALISAARSCGASSVNVSSLRVGR